MVEVDSGVSLGKLVEFLDSQKLSIGGFTNLPGSIGGNLFLSQFLQMVCKSIKVLDSENEVEEISSDELSLKKHIILSATLRVKAKI